MLEGLIVKGYSGFYYVDTGHGVYECSLRGRLKKQQKSPLVGDKVKITVIQQDKGVIEDILPRFSQLIRPPIANVNQVIIVFAVKEPKPMFSLLEKMLVLAEKEDIKPIICFNKIDLIDEEVLNQWIDIYRQIGYQVFCVTGKLNKGIEALKKQLEGKISVFAGPSGVGKSTLLNCIQPGLSLKTGEVSEKIGRGKHTTRHAELISLASGGWVADTPGFSSLHLPDMDKEQLIDLFPEFSDYTDKCKYTGCLHNKEPECGVKDAVDQNLVPKQRYDTYLEFLAEVIEKEDRRY